MHDPRARSFPGAHDHGELQLHPDAAEEWRPPCPVRAPPSVDRRARASLSKQTHEHLLRTGDARSAPMVDKQWVRDGELGLRDGSAELVEFVCMAKHAADPTADGYTLAMRSELT